MRSPVAALAMLLGAACAATGAETPPAAATPAATAEPAAPSTPAARPDPRTPGERLYGRHCLPCHQSDGYGVPDMQPAIVGGNWVKGDSRALAMFVMTGGFGSAERKDSANGNVMPEFRQLPDEDLAQILTYIRAKFGGGGSAVSAADVAAARADLPK
jgi:mono/diheme cytochrome c family protein